ncbi:MAG: hypothetical protein K2X47_19815 [Bdellovibrionales bacterium]|nr:hypothetical protein [Bdellovibrionales bacterium]
MMKAAGFLVLVTVLSSSVSFAHTTEAGEAKAALSETMLDARMAAAEKEISEPVFGEKKKVETPVLMQLSENEIETTVSDEEDFVLDEE